MDISPLFPPPVETGRICQFSIRNLDGADAPDGSNAPIFTAEEPGVFLVTSTGHVTASTVSEGATGWALVTPAFPDNGTALKGGVSFGAPGETLDGFLIVTIFLAKGDSLSLDFFTDGTPGDVCDLYITVQRIV